MRPIIIIYTPKINKTGEEQIVFYNRAALLLQCIVNFPIARQELSDSAAN